MTKENIRILFIAVSLLLFAGQWVAVNLEDDKKFYNFTFVLCFMVQAMSLAMWEL